MRSGNPHNHNAFPLHGPATVAASAALIVGANLLMQPGCDNMPVLQQPSPAKEQHAVPQSEVVLFADVIPPEDGTGLHLMPYARQFDRDPQADQVDPADVSVVVRHLESLQRDGAYDLVVGVSGSASDEARFSPDGGIGHLNPENERLAKVRAEAYTAKLSKALGKTTLADVPVKAVSAGEAVLNPHEQSKLDHLAQKHDMTRSQAIVAFNDGRKLPGDLGDALHKALTEQRGTHLVVSGFRPPRPQTQLAKADTGKRLIGDAEYDPWALLALPILRRRKEPACKGELELFRGGQPAMPSQFGRVSETGPAKPRVPVGALPRGSYMSATEFAPGPRPMLAIEAAPRRLALLPAEQDRARIGGVSLEKTVAPPTAE